MVCIIVTSGSRPNHPRRASINFSLWRRGRYRHPHALAYLQQLGLLFEERGRVMSLVMEGLRFDLGAGLQGYSGSKGRAENAALGLTF